MQRAVRRTLGVVRWESAVSACNLDLRSVWLLVRVVGQEPCQRSLASQVVVHLVGFLSVSVGYPQEGRSLAVEVCQSNLEVDL